MCIPPSEVRLVELRLEENMALFNRRAHDLLLGDRGSIPTRPATSFVSFFQFL